MVIEWFRVDTETRLSLPYYPNGLKAGTFPSPAADFIELPLDLNKLLIRNKNASFFVKVEGDSMIGRGIDDGDILLVDRSIRYKNGSIGVFSINREFRVKEVLIDKGQLILMSANEKYEPIPITKDMDFEEWGTVTYCIKKFI